MREEVSKLPFSPVVGQTGSSYRWAMLAITFMTFSIVYMQRFTLGPLAPFIQTDMGVSKAQIGIFSSMITAGYCVFLIPAGWVCDRLGVRRTICFGQLFAGSALICILFAQSLNMIMFMMFLSGLGLGFLSPSTTKAIVVWFPIKERAMAMGIKQMSVNAGGMIVAVGIPVVALAYGWRIGFVCIGIVAILSGILAAIFYKEVPTTPATASSVSSVASVKKESWLTAFKSRDIWLLCMGGIGLFIAEMGVMTYFLLYLKSQLLVPVVTAGFLLGAINMGGFFGKPISGIISDRLLDGRRKPAFIMLGAISTIFTVVFALMPPGTTQWIILVCAVLFGFAALGWAGIFNTMVAEMAGKDNVAIVNGATTLILALANLIGVPIFGYISDVTGSWTWSWIYLIIVGTIGTVSLFFVREHKRKLSSQ